MHALNACLSYQNQLNVQLCYIELKVVQNIKVREDTYVLCSHSKPYSQGLILWNVWCIWEPEYHLLESKWPVRIDYMVTKENCMILVKRLLLRGHTSPFSCGLLQETQEFTMTARYCCVPHGEVHDILLWIRFWANWRPIDQIHRWRQIKLKNLLTTAIIIIGI